MSSSKITALNNWGDATQILDAKNQILFNFASELEKSTFLDFFLTLSNHFRKCKIATSIGLNVDEIGVQIALGWVVADFNSSTTILFDLVKNKENADVKIISNRIDKEIVQALPETDFIGFQRHLVPYADLLHVDTYSLGSTSLGMIKNRHTELEPVFRTVQLVSFETVAGRSSEWPEINDALPAGLSVEEICQIFRYSGSSYQIEYLGIHGFNLHPENIKSMAIAVWYFIEGLDSRVFKNEYAVAGFQEFVLNVKDIDESLVFSINTDDGKWWVRVEDSEKLVPCSKEDYERASMGFLSDRLFRKLFT